MNLDSFKTQQKHMLSLFRHWRKMNKCMQGRIDCEAHYRSMLIKQVHAIEKGLCMPNFRFGFGQSRIDSMMGYMHLLLDGEKFSGYEEIKMAVNALRRYIDVHEDAEYSSAEYEALKARINVTLAKFSGVSDDPDMAGFKVIRPYDVDLDGAGFEKVLTTRHSVREFDQDRPVDDGQLTHAIELALCAPSACNRQTARVYILDHSDFSLINKWRGGVKGFIDVVDKLLIVTGQMAGYEGDEFFQYCVSSSIFTGYLTLTLHAQGIGACVLQRSLLEDEQWQHLKRNLHIPENEQVICAVAVGMPKDEIKVPVSHRLPVDTVAKFVGSHYGK